MFLLIGWGKQTTKITDQCLETTVTAVITKSCGSYIQDALGLLCFYSHNSVFYRTSVVCPVCSHAAIITSAKFDELKEVADCNMDLINKKIGEDEHKNKISQLMKESK